MVYQTLFFDLDDTLYPHTAGLWEAIRVRMDAYMRQRLGLPESEIPRLRQYYLETYGTTLRGLQNQFHVDAQDFLAFVHDLPLEQYLQPNPALRELLLSLPQKRYIFTNADQAHAGRVLRVLALEGCFEAIIDVNALEFIPKPDLAAYRRALALADAQAETSVLFDDAERNLKPAQQLGFTTVWVGAPPPPLQIGEGVQPQRNGRCLRIGSLEELPRKMPELWRPHPPPSRTRSEV